MNKIKNWCLVLLPALVLMFTANAAKYFTDIVVEDGKVQMRERSGTPSFITNYGFIYPKTDGRLYYMDDVGAEYDVLLGGNADLEDLNNVDTSGKATGDILRWDGYNWVDSDDVFVFDNGVGVGASPDVTTVFDVFSNTKGSRPCPSLTSASRDLIVSPATGLCVFNTTASVYQNYDGTSWKTMGGGVVPWVTANSYATNDVIHVDEKIYRTIISHTSGTFATDLAALRWQELSDDVNRLTTASDSAIVLWDGTGGDTVKNSVVTISSTGSITGLSDVIYSGTLTTPLTVDRIPYIGAGGALTATPGLVYTASDSSITVGGSLLIDDGLIYLGNRSDPTSLFLGPSSGIGNTSASIRSVGIGLNALFSLSSGDNNVAIGWQSGDALISGNSNVSIGASSMGTNASSNENTAIGASSLTSNTAAGNTAVGFGSLFSNSTGTGNTSIGRNSILLNTTGSSNTAIGYEAGSATANNLSNNIYIGYQAGQNNTASGSLYVDVTSTETPLIRGNFTTDVVMINGRLEATSTLLASNPCPDMTTAQKNAIVGATLGDCVYDTTLLKPQSYNGSSWTSMGGADGLTNTRVPFTNATGDLVDDAGLTYIATSDTLSVGVLNLTTALDDIFGGTGYSSYTTGDILYASDATTLTKLGAGASDSVLTMGPSLPRWTSSTLTSGRVALIGTSGLMTDDSGITYSAASDSILLGGIKVSSTTMASTSCNPVTSAQRETIGAGLGSGDKGSCVYDNEVLAQFNWNGTGWVQQSAATDSQYWAGTLAGADIPLGTAADAGVWKQTASPGLTTLVIEKSSGGIACTGISGGSIGLTCTGVTPGNKKVCIGGLRSTSGTAVDQSFRFASCDGTDVCSTTTADLTTVWTDTSTLATDRSGPNYTCRTVEFSTSGTKAINLQEMTDTATAVSTNSILASSLNRAIYMSIEDAAPSGGGLNDAVYTLGFSKVSGPVSVTGVIPADDTIPQVGEGTQVLTVTVTPKRIGAIIHVSVNVKAIEETNTVGAIVAALFKNGSADAVAADGSGSTESSLNFVEDRFEMEYEEAVASLSPITFTVRVGGGAGSPNIVLNESNVRSTPADFGLGSTISSWIKVTEEKY